MRFFGKVIVGLLPLMPRFLVRWISRRYVAGDSLEKAVVVLKKLDASGFSTTIDVLGEEIKSLDEAKLFYDEYLKVLDVITSNEFNANISIKPTAFGLLIDKKDAYELIVELVSAAKKNNIFVRLDMEDHRVTDDTIELLMALHEKGLDNVGTVLQSRLFRTSEDISKISEKLNESADYRICKGIYLEPKEISHTGYSEIVDSFCTHIDEMLDANSYVGIATHDYPIVEYAKQSLERRGLGPNIVDPRVGNYSRLDDKGPGYEFQLLLGVRGNLGRKLLGEGHKVRVYVPYGEQWYEYSMRRLRENPTVAWQVAKSIIFPWTNRR